MARRSKKLNPKSVEPNPSPPMVEPPKPRPPQTPLIPPKASATSSRAESEGIAFTGTPPTRYLRRERHKGYSRRSVRGPGAAPPPPPRPAIDSALEYIGQEGTWTPQPNDGVVPADLAAMAGITSSPSIPWRDASFMTLGDASKAYWDGQAWVAGAAPAS